MINLQGDSPEIAVKNLWIALNKSEKKLLILLAGYFTFCFLTMFLLTLLLPK